MIWFCCNTEPCNCAFVFLFVGPCICNKVYYEQNSIRFFGIFHLHVLASLLTWMRHVLIKRLFSYLFFLLIIFLLCYCLCFFHKKATGGGGVAVQQWLTGWLQQRSLVRIDLDQPAAEASNSQTRLNQLLQPPLSKNVTLGCLEFRPQPDYYNQHCCFCHQLQINVVKDFYGWPVAKCQPGTPLMN